MRHAIAVFLAILAMAVLPGARAADIRVTRAADTGIVVVSVEGEMKQEDGARFAEAIRPLDRAVVAFNSPGGSLLAGLQMGRLIRLKHFATWVPDGLLCASACASAWLAGAPRAMQPGSHIGFHAAFIEQAGQKIETGVGNALAGAYFGELGLSAEAIIFIEKARPDDLTWLTPADAARLGITVSLLPSGETAPVATPRPETVQDPAPEPSASSLEARARGFADDYFAHWSETGEQVLAFFGETYASQVTFYGQNLAQGDILAAKRDYTERWPVRVYSARPETLGAFCNPTTRLCALTGTVDWDCRAADRKARSTGSATFILTLDMRRERPLILAEAGAVLSHRAP